MDVKYYLLRVKFDFDFDDFDFFLILETFCIISNKCRIMQRTKNLKVPFIFFFGFSIIVILSILTKKLDID